VSRRDNVHAAEMAAHDQTSVGGDVFGASR
jgi:hypothetical protein